MKLSEWINQNREREEELAAGLGCTLDYVRKLSRGIRRPSPEKARQIEQITNGAVAKEQLIWPE